MSHDETILPTDPAIYSKGSVVAVLDGSMEVVEAVVRCASRNGPEMDWHYMGGRAVVKTLGDIEQAGAALVLAMPRDLRVGDHSLPDYMKALVTINLNKQPVRNALPETEEVVEVPEVDKMQYRTPLNEMNKHSLGAFIKEAARTYAEKFSTSHPVGIVQEVCNDVWLVQNSNIVRYELDEKDYQDKELMEKFESVEFVIEANSTEIQFLWTNHSDESPPQELIKGHYTKKVKWVSENSSPGRTIGKILNKPICVWFRFAQLNGLKVVFVECTSLIQDYGMIDEWLLKYCNPQRNGRRAHTDAGNFHDVIHAANEKKA